MKAFKRVLFFAALMLIVFSLSACLETSSGDSTNNSETDQVKTQTPELSEGEVKITIGYSGPLSGSGAQYGLNVLNGLKMAADEINETGFDVNGKTYKIEIVSYDDKYLPNETGINVQRLLSEEDPIAVWIPHSGGVFATQVFNEEEDVIIMAQTSEPRMYEQGNKLMIGISPQYSIWPKIFGENMLENFGNKMALVPTNSQYGKDWLNVIKPAWEEIGGEVVFENPIDFAKETDYFTIMTNALNAKPDVLFVGGPSEVTALIIKQAKELGFEGGFMVMDQAKIEEMAVFLDGYELLNGAIGAFPVEELGTTASNTFVEKYKTTFNEKFATADSSLSYQGLYVLVESMKAAGSIDDSQSIMNAVSEGIQNLPEDKMVIPLKEIDEVGSLQWEFAAGAVVDGKVVAIPLEK